MRSTRDGVDTDRLFNGLAWDLNGLDERWLLSLYGLYQRFDGETDRRALGAEGRYLGDTVTAYSLLDYDTYFDELNIFYLFGNWRIQEGTVASLTLDYRRSPGLALSNALYSVGADDFDDLGPDLSDDDLERLAKDRSLIYRSLYASLTQQLNDRWPGLRDRLCEPGPELRMHIHVYVDRERATLASPIEARSRVDVISAISGG